MHRLLIYFSQLSFCLLRLIWSGVGNSGSVSIPIKGCVLLAAAHRSSCCSPLMIWSALMSTASNEDCWASCHWSPQIDIALPLSCLSIPPPHFSTSSRLTRTLPLCRSQRLPPFLCFFLFLVSLVFPRRPTFSSMLSQCVRRGGINYWPSAAGPLPNHNLLFFFFFFFFLIEGINEWSAHEMVRCHGSRVAPCTDGEQLGDGLFDQLRMANSGLPRRQFAAVNASVLIIPRLLITSRKEESRATISQFSVLSISFADDDFMRSALCELPLLVASVSLASAQCVLLYSGFEVSHVFFFPLPVPPTPSFTDGISCLHSSPSTPPPPSHSGQQWDRLAMWADNGTHAVRGGEHVWCGPGHRARVPGALRAWYQCEPGRHCVAGNWRW